ECMCIQDRDGGRRRRDEMVGSGRRLVSASWSFAISRDRALLRPTSAPSPDCLSRACPSGRASPNRSDAGDRRWAVLCSWHMAPRLLDYGNAVVGVDAAHCSVVTPIPIAPLAVFRRALQFLGRKPGDIAAKLGVVFQRLPGQRIVIVAETEKSAEAKH